MKKAKTLSLPAAILIFIFASGLAGQGQKKYSPSPVSQVVFLGTGNPNADPHRSGNSVAIVVNNTPYIVDFGPGLIRKAAALSPQYGGKIEGLKVANINRAFLTHLHSDHTSGLSRPDPDTLGAGSGRTAGSVRTRRDHLDDPSHPGGLQGRYPHPAVWTGAGQQPGLAGDQP